MFGREKRKEQGEGYGLSFGWFAGSDEREKENIVGGVDG